MIGEAQQFMASAKKDTVSKVNFMVNTLEFNRKQTINGSDCLIHKSRNNQKNAVSV